MSRSLTAKLRRIALNQQGLLKPGSFGRGKRATLRAIEQIGYVQIDTISVVERAHHHVLWSRVENYRPKFLDQLVREREVFEYWFHAAAWLPMKDYRFALPRMSKMNGGFYLDKTTRVFFRPYIMPAGGATGVRTSGRYPDGMFDDNSQSIHQTRWYTCMQKPHKFMPEMDELLCRLLQQDQQGIVILHQPDTAKMTASLQ